MIKKYFKYIFGLFVVGFGIINFSSAGYLRDIGVYGYSPYDQSYNVNVISKGSFLTEKLGYTKDIFYVKGDGNERAFMFWDLNGLPYFYVSQLGQDSYRRASTLQGEIIDYNVCDVLQDVEGYTPQNCTRQYVGIYTVDIFSSFLSKVKSTDLFYFDLSHGESSRATNTVLTVCISSETVGSSLCFVGHTCKGDRGFCYDEVGTSGTNLYNFNDNNIAFDTIDSSLLFKSPAVSGVGGNGSSGEMGEGSIVLGSDESAINYFENRYGRDESICYAGIDNVTDLWGSSVSFEQGSGLNIFQVFSGLYGNSDLDKVYVWLNSRLINYGQWFGREGDPLYLSTYNSGENKVDLYYTGFSFPFLNNPVAIYFLASNIYDNSESASMGSEVVSYCNLKIQEGSFDEIIDQSIKNNITNYTEQSNKNNGLNPDGTEKNGYNYFTGSTDYTGSIGSRTGMTWQDIEYSGNVDMKSIFQKGLDEMKSALDNFHNPFTGVLPQYIISALLFVCLFKLLRR